MTDLSLMKKSTDREFWSNAGCLNISMTKDMLKMVYEKQKQEKDDTRELPQKFAKFLVGFCALGIFVKILWFMRAAPIVGRTVFSTLRCA